MDSQQAFTDQDFKRRLRYSLFKSVCDILEVGCAPEDLARVRRQRAELEKKLGYEAYRAEEAGLSQSVLEESEESRAFEHRARRRIRSALKRKLKPGEKIRVPKF